MKKLIAIIVLCLIAVSAYAYTTIQLRRDTASNWIATNPILAVGEMGIETTTLKMKIGNGVTPWVSLPYASSPPAHNTELVSHYASFDAAVTALGSTPTTLYLDVASTMTATTTVPTTLSIQASINGTITKGSGSLTINGPFSAGLYQVFSGFSAGNIAGLKSVYPEWFGDVTTDAGPSINKAASAVINGGSIELIKSSYPIGTTVKFPLSSRGIKLFSRNNSQLLITTDIDCLDITATNENYGWHSVEGITLTGLNNYYANTMTLSTGVGIRMQRDYADTTNAATAYNTVLRDITVSGFKYGIRMQSALKTHVVGKSTLRMNQYGLYIDGGQTNANNFDGVSIELNSVAGIYSSGTNGGSLTDATNNVFNGCMIQSNHPYGFTTGDGIYLIRSYDFIFRDCYFEANRYAIRITAPASGNMAVSCRFAPGSAGLLGGIKLEGAVVSNSFIGCIMLSSDTTTPNVFTDVNQFYNQFLDNTGFTFISGSLGTVPIVRNNQPYSTLFGTMNGTINMPSYGFMQNPGTGTTAGKIESIGTTTAILHANGYGEVYLGNQITSATTITAFDGLTQGQFLTIWNYQTAYPVTIKSGLPYESIYLQGGRDLVFTDYGQMVTFYITSGQGKAYEVGRNFHKNASSTDTGFLSSTDWATFNSKQSGLVTGVTGSIFGVTTLFNMSGNAMYMVYISCLTGDCATANYYSSATLFNSSVDSRVVTTNNSAYLPLTISGSAVQTNPSFTMKVKYSYLKM